MNNKYDFLVEFENYKKRLHSSENIIICEPFEKECSRFYKIADEYKNITSEQISRTQKKIVREEYSVKGEELERGFYSPSPIIDIVIGNCSRGRLLKRLTVKSKISFSYGFDDFNRLISVNSWVDGKLATFENILYFDNSALGITYTSDHTITSICEEVFENDRKKSIVQVFFKLTNYGTKIFELHNEKYLYKKKGINICDFYTYYPDMPLLKHLKYHFEHNSEGYLSKYTVTEFDGEAIKKSYWDGHLFDITIKRKV